MKNTPTQKLGQKLGQTPPKNLGQKPTKKIEKKLPIAISGAELTPEGGLSRYLRTIQSYPILGAEEEMELARKWRDHKDSEAANLLVTSHLRLVAKIAMGYRGYGLPIAEVISEGNVGLMRAVQRFDPEKGFRLTSYAIWWIKASIQEYVLRSWSLVKIGTTAAQKKLFFKLRKTKDEIRAFEAGDLRPEHLSQIAEKLDVSEREVTSMNRRLSHNDLSLNQPLNQENESGEWIDWIPDDHDNQEIILEQKQEYSHRKKLLDEAIKTLGEREREILTARKLQDNPATLEELSHHYNLSRERVRQIEVRAFEKLQKEISRVNLSHQP